MKGDDGFPNIRLDFSEQHKYNVSNMHIYDAFHIWT